VGNLLADIFVTIGGRQTPQRLEIIKKSLESLHNSIADGLARFTICLDGESSFAIDKNNSLPEWADFILASKENVGLGPTINRAIAHIKTINDWYAHPTHGDTSKVAPFIVCCQDDCLYSDKWLPSLASKFIAFEHQHKLGFASGHGSPEHAGTRRHQLGGGMFLQDWVRMTNLLARREYWESMCPISRFDPETRNVRAKPNDGVGSSVDWWFLRNHEKSVCKTGRTNLVIPGLVLHPGFESSTWLNRNLPESDADLEAMK